MKSEENSAFPGEQQESIANGETKVEDDEGTTLMVRSFPPLQEGNRNCV